MKRSRFWSRVVGIGMVIVFGGLLVMLVSGIGDALEAAWELPVLMSGLGFFLIGGIIVSVGSVMGRKAEREEVQVRANSLPENAFLLTPYTTAVFSEKGLSVEEDEIFQEEAQTYPIEKLTVYRTREMNSPKRMGKEQTYLTFRLRAENGKDDTWRDIYSLNERGLRLAEQYGVKIVDKRAPYRPDSKLLKQFIRRRQGICVYDSGILVKNFGVKHFFPIEMVEKVERVGNGLSFVIGYTRDWVPDNGAYEYLKEKFPEKCGE